MAQPQNSKEFKIEEVFFLPKQWVCVTLCEDGVRQMCLCWIYSAGRGRAVEEGGRGVVQPEPIADVTFKDWPPFTGCWHGCYIKEMPPTAAPDSLKHWHCWELGGGAPVRPSCYLHHSGEGHFFAEAVCNLQLSYSPGLSIKFMSWQRRLIYAASCWFHALWPWGNFFFFLDMQA